MATKQVVLDDIDGSEGAETIRISVGDETIEIDLGSDNRDKLQKALSTYFQHGRPVVKKAAGNSDTAKVREWLQANGHQVNDKGRIPEELQAIYHAAHANPS
jgi:D-hexose-6-phosphate mutarotase